MQDQGHPRVVWHGLTDGMPLDGFGIGRREVFLAHDIELARVYAADGPDGIIIQVEDLSRNPLSLAMGEAFRDAWLASGAGDVAGSFHPDATGAFSEWARAMGHDAIVIPSSAFEGEIGFDWVSGTVGEPQTIVLDPTRIRVVAVHGLPEDGVRLSR